MTPRPGVRVVCVTYHPGPELEEFATSLRAATEAPVELVLVDNGDDHAVTTQVAEQHGATLLTPGDNLGYGAAANLGARGATQAWVVVANPDVVWHAGSLDTLVAAGERTGAGAVGPPPRPTPPPPDPAPDALRTRTRPPQKPRSHHPPGTTAVTSISTLARSSIRSAPWNAVIGGKCRPITSR